jgi:LDH2 family malate/lactate/ureidoglycolate dehydrogenase
MHEKKSVLFSEKRLKDFCRESFQKTGLSQEDAELTADTLVKSERMGVSSHGVVRLPFYCKRLIDGGTKTDPKMEILAEKPAMLLIDGDNGLGQTTSIKAMKMAMDKAKTSGICFAGVKNSCHFGMAAYYAMTAIEEDMIGVAGTNAPPVMAAWGGSKSVIGNNPLSIAIPTEEEFPLVLDISMSVVSGGKVRLAAVNKERIPKDWILDAKGEPTDRPEDFFPDGTLLPMGHKGFGLAIMIEVLTGVLTGAGILSQMGLWFKDTAIPINNGHFFMALDVKAFCDPEIFKKRIHQMIDELKSCPLSEGSEGIFMPGEIEFLKNQACRKNGISISLGVLRGLNEFASEIGIPKLVA